MTDDIEVDDYYPASEEEHRRYASLNLVLEPVSIMAAHGLIAHDMGAFLVDCADQVCQYLENGPPEKKAQDGAAILKMVKGDD
jgi:hypothetical protein